MIIAVSVALAGCGDEPRTSDEPASATAPLAGTEWAFDPASVGVTGAGTAQATIRFGTDTFEGNDGCGPFSGTYDRAGSKLELDTLESTADGCQRAARAIARKLLAGLPETATYTVAELPKVSSYKGAPLTLTLLDARGRAVLAFGSK